MTAALPATAPGFSRALAGAGPVFWAFLAIHVLGGLTAVISGVLAATAPKRRGRHTRACTICHWAITAVFATAAAMTAMRPARDWYLALLGALAFLLAAAGRCPAPPPELAWLDHPSGPHPAHHRHGWLLHRAAHRVLRRQRQEPAAMGQAPHRGLLAAAAIAAAPLIARSVRQHRRPPATPAPREAAR